MNGKGDDPRLGTCFQNKNCQGEMQDKGKVSKQKCEAFGGKSWMSQVTGECEEIDHPSSD